LMPLIARDSRHDRGSYVLIDPRDLRDEVKQKLGWQKPVKAVFDSPPPQDIENAEVLGRNHPFVAYLSEQILGRAFHPASERENYRCGAAYTAAVKTRTVVLLLRVRYRLSRRGQHDQFAEEVITTGYRSEGGEVHWFEANHPDVLELVEKAEAVGNISLAEKQQRIEAALHESQAARAKTPGNCQWSLPGAGSRA